MIFDNINDSETQPAGERCNNCGAPKQTKLMARAVHDGPFPKTGGGKVEHEIVFWCTNCDVEPPDQGEPIDDPLGNWGRSQTQKED